MLALLFKTKLGQLMLLASAFIITYVAWQRPTWAMEPLDSLLTSLLERFGVGILPGFLWGIIFLGLLRYKPGLLFKRWRLVFGSASLVAGIQGILSYFSTELPSLGTYNLGGSYGHAIKGDSLPLGYFRIAGLIMLSLWILLPKTVLPTSYLRLAYTVGIMVRGFILLLRFLRSFIINPLIWLLSSPIKIRRSLKRQPNTETAVTQPPDGEYLLPNDTDPTLTNSLDVVTDIRELPSNDPPPETPPGTDQMESINRAITYAQNTSRSNGKWELPSMTIFQPPEPEPQPLEDHTVTARIIEQALGQHGVAVEVSEIRPGPTVTMFGLVPGWVRKGKSRSHIDGTENDASVSESPNTTSANRVKVDSILARERDLALALAAPTLRIQAPVPGESLVGVEVPNRTPSIVRISNVMHSDMYHKVLEKEGLSVALGVASDGEPVAIDLTAMPHLLIAGATGRGKSVCLNSIITSLITHQLPDKVRLLLVDPKRVELTQYNGIPHLVNPVVVEASRAVLLLKGAISEMLRRYKLLEEAGVRDIRSYNNSPKSTEYIPYLVICIDELADLMMSSTYDAEQSICRLAQLGRATGIHLVVATQRPSVDVVTGLIKANFPSRISFAVASQVDSRTIIDSVGAERLLGRGDMLFMSPDFSKPRRVQGVYVSEEETESVTKHWSQQPPAHISQIPLEDLAYQAQRENIETNNARSAADQDPLLQQALDLATSNRHISTSLLQRRLRIGYPRAARLMDQLEEEGIVAPGNEPGKPREVLD